MSNKVYVDVLAEFSKDGLLIPKEITWEDGRKYEITRVKDKRRAASRCQKLLEKKTGAAQPVQGLVELESVIPVW